MNQRSLAIEWAFRGHQDVRIESVNKAILDTTGISRFIRDSMLLMVDVDHYDGKNDVLVEGIRREPVNAQVPVILLTFLKNYVDTHFAHEGKAVKNQELIRLNLFIKEWLIHHILYEDKLIGLSMPKG